MFALQVTSGFYVGSYASGFTKDGLLFVTDKIEGTAKGNNKALTYATDAEAAYARTQYNAQRLPAGATHTALAVVEVKPTIEEVAEACFAHLPKAERVPAAQRVAKAGREEAVTLGVLPGKGKTTGRKPLSRKQRRAASPYVYRNVWQLKIGDKAIRGTITAISGGGSEETFDVRYLSFDNGEPEAFSADAALAIEK